MPLPANTPSNVSAPIFPPNTSNASAVSIVPNSSAANSISQQSQNSNNPGSRKHISRLFSKQRVHSSSVSRVTQNSDPYDSTDIESFNSQNSGPSSVNTGGINSSQGAAPPNNFRRPSSSRLKSRLKLSSSNGVPDLKISTNSHGSLKVPKKILSANLTDDNSGIHRKLSMASPSGTLHSLFHRNHTIPPNQAESIHSNLPAEDGRSVPARTAVTLSSNSSNSFITDVKLAMQYNFTNPDYVGGGDETDRDLDRDHTKLAEIHRKLMVPTDQYFQQKQTASPNKPGDPSSGLGISIRDNEKLSTISDRNRFARFFKVLLSATKPLYVPSQYRRMPNGQYAPFLGCTLQDIACYVRANYVADISQVTAPYSRASASSLPSPVESSSPVGFAAPQFAMFDSLPATQSSSPSLGHNRQNKLKPVRRQALQYLELLDLYSVKDISQDLRIYFTRAMTLLYKDQIESSRPQLDMNAIDSEMLLSSIINLWTQIFHLYTLFNTRIRYTVLECLQPLQTHMHNQYSQRFASLDDPGPTIEIENMLVLAFRDTIIVPNLSERSKLYFAAEEMNWGVSIAEEEGAIFRTNSTLHRALIGCFGNIHSTTLGELGNTDGQQHTRNHIFAAAYNYISGIHS